MGNKWLHALIICYVAFMYNILLTATRNENISRRYHHSKTKEDLKHCQMKCFRHQPLKFMKLWWQAAWETIFKRNSRYTIHDSLWLVSFPDYFIAREGNETIHGCVPGCHEALGPNSLPLCGETQSDNVRYYVSMVALHASAVGDERWRWGLYCLLHWLCAAGPGVCTHKVSAPRVVSCKLARCE